MIKIRLERLFNNWSKVQSQIGIITFSRNDKGSELNLDQLIAMALRSVSMCSINLKSIWGIRIQIHEERISMNILSIANKH